MIQLLFVLAYLTQIANASNSTSSSVQQPVGDTTTRSVWSILGSCALTLLVCIWHAAHFDISYPKVGPYSSSVGLVLWSVLGPEVVIGTAMEQWWEARHRVAAFREKGYEWSMTHSFFAEMGGFVYCDDKGKSRTINSFEFLELCETNKIVNPHVTVKQIKALSKSDALGKAVFVLQLLWFTLQVVVRGSHGLAVTLVELDTVSLAALALLALWFWWEKPHHPECPHIFYYLPPEVESYPRTDAVLKNVWKAEPSRLYRLMIRFVRMRKTRAIGGDEEIALVGTELNDISNDQRKPVGDMHDRPVPAESNDGGAPLLAICGAWLVLGALHLIAWNFHFPTVTEKILWRVASLILAAGSLVSLIFGSLVAFLVSCLGGADDTAGGVFAAFWSSVLILGVVSRVLLLALMLASLRALPPSAYQTISWTAYIPHL